MAVLSDVNKFSQKLDQLSQTTVSEADYKAVLQENKLLKDAANALIQSSTELREKLEEITRKLALIEKKINRQFDLNAEQAEQKKLLQAQKDFRDICIEIRDGKYEHGDCKASVNAIMGRLRNIPYPFACFVYRGPAGGDNWGYHCSTHNSNYQHHWRGSKCYVTFQCNPARGSTGSFEPEARAASGPAVKRHGGGSCIDMAGDIIRHLGNKGMPPQFVLVKKEPGGFGNWAYNSTESRNSYHQWLKADDGGWFKSDTEYCVGSRM